MESETFIISRRRRRSRPVDLCPGYTQAPSAVLQAFVTSPTLRHVSPALTPPSLSPFLLDMQKQGRLPRVLGDNTPQAESDFPSPTISPVVTVEAFLQRSAAKRIKTYKKRKRPVPLIHQTEEDDGKTGIYEELILPMGARKHPRRAAEVLPWDIAKSRIKKTGLVSRLTRAARFTNVPRAVDPKELYNAADRIESLLVPPDFLQVNDLDIPFRNTTKTKGRNAIKWALIDPRNARASGFPLPGNFCPPILQPCLSPKDPDSELKPLTHWSNNYSAANFLPGVPRARGSKEKVSSHASAPLQFVSWEEHENGLRRFRMQHITMRPKNSQSGMLEECPRSGAKSAFDSKIQINRSPLEIHNPIDHIDPSSSPEAITKPIKIHTELSASDDSRSIYKVADRRVERLATGQGLLTAKTFRQISHARELKSASPLMHNE